MIFNLLNYNLHYLNKISQSFKTELELASHQRTSSLGFFSYSLPTQRYSTDNAPFQVMSIGGTNLESVVVSPKKPHDLGTIYRQPLPVFSTARDLYQIIRNSLNPEIQKLFLNFAYPIEPTIRQNRIDGKLSKATKEHTFQGLVGSLVGEYMEQSYYSETGKTIEVIVYNDVVGLALSELAENTTEANSLMSMVLGTGNNFGLFIDKTTVVNLESGNFDNFTSTPSGAFIDRQSNNIGSQLFEKEVAGKYLFEHVNYYAQKNGIQERLTASKQVNELAVRSDSMGLLCQHLVNRSASMVAALIKGIWLYKQQQTLVCPVEGSIYWKGYHYPQLVNSWLYKLGLPENSIHFKKITHSNLRGGVALALWKSK